MANVRLLWRPQSNGPKEKQGRACACVCVLYSASQDAGMFTVNLPSKRWIGVSIAVSKFGPARKETCAKIQMVIWGKKGGSATRRIRNVAECGHRHGSDTRVVKCGHLHGPDTQRVPLQNAVGPLDNRRIDHLVINHASAAPLRLSRCGMERKGGESLINDLKFRSRNNKYETRFVGGKGKGKKKKKKKKKKETRDQPGRERPRR